MKAEDFKDFKQGDALVVVWHDACSFHVTVFTEEAYVTRKETMGSFLGIFRDPYSGFEYLVLRYEKMLGGDEIEGTSIPLVCIESVRRLVGEEKELRNKKSLKEFKLLDPPVNLKVIRASKKVRVRGGVKTIEFLKKTDRFR